jgi:hypothetical protein
MEKMKTLETVPGIGGKGMKVNDGGSEFNYNILHELW